MCVCCHLLRVCVQGLSAAVSACERWMEQRASVGVCLCVCGGVWPGNSGRIGVCGCSWYLAPELVLVTPTAIKGDLTTPKPCFWKR